MPMNMTTVYERNGRKYTIIVTRQNSANTETTYSLDIKEANGTRVYTGSVSSKIIERLSQRAKHSIEDCLASVAADILNEWFP